MMDEYEDLLQYKADQESIFYSYKYSLFDDFL